MPRNNRHPIYHATKSLNMRYSFNYCVVEDATVEVPAADIHATLLVGCEEMLSTRSDLKHKTGTKVYSKSIDNVNFATAAITFLYADSDRNEGYLGEEVLQNTFYLSVCDTTQRLNSSHDFYTKPYSQAGVTSSKAARDNDFNLLLSQRLSAFSEIVANYDPFQATVTTLKGLNAVIAGPMFHETYHHSEQAIMHHLSSKKGIRTLVRWAQQSDANYMYGVVLDIYSQRMLCENCNVCLLGMQNTHEKGFLSDFSAALEQGRIQPRVNDHLMLSTRVSASKPNKSGTLEPLTLPTDQDTVHDYDADLTNEVFQAKNNLLGTRNIINTQHLTLASYRGTFFPSSQLKLQKLEEAIRLTAEPVAPGV